MGYFARVRTAVALGLIALSPPSIDLGTAKVDGRVVLGRTMAGVTAALGSPTQSFPAQQRSTMRYGSPWNVQVLFRREQGALRAWSVAVLDPKLTPATVQRTVLAQYSDRYSLTRPYACTYTGCRGDFAPTGTHTLHLGFGLTPGSKQAYVVLFRSSSG